MRQPLKRNIQSALFAGTISYWTIWLDTEGDAFWVRATGVRAMIGSFGLFYVGRCMDKASEPYMVTHPETGIAVCHGSLYSVQEALALAAHKLTEVGAEQVRSVIASLPRYQKPPVDPDHCDADMIVAERETYAPSA